MPNALLVYNPAAGLIPPELLVAPAAKVLRSRGWQVEIEATRSGDHVTRLARQAARAELDALFVAGGDGSIGKAVAGLLGSDTALGVLPAGTANVWALEIGLPRNRLTKPHILETCASILAAGQTQTVDVGLCNGVPFLLWAGIGLDGLVVKQLESRRKRWKKLFVVLQYSLVAFWHGSTWPGMHLQMEIHPAAASKNSPVRKIKGHFMVAVASNIRYYAGGLAQISPNAKLADGQMDLWLFSGGRRKVLKHAWNLWTSKHVQDPEIQCIPFTHLKIYAENPAFVQTDGEPQARSTCVEIKIRQQALKVLVPEGIRLP